MMENSSLSLYELNTLIKEVISFSFTDVYWVKAEIAKITENISGHCYLELVEKSENGDMIIAQTKAMIWRNHYWRIQPYFYSVTGKDLTVGMKILFKAKVEFHQVYGLSLHILDIDPNYTLGELMVRKKQIIDLLKREGIFDMNKMLTLPLVPQRIAIISSPTAAGYTDFLTHMKQNVYHYKFYMTLFKAAMQGENAEKSIIDALEKIHQKVSQFDVVVIIRGGGAQVDLSCFDSYLLASHVAQFPLPILTGIGHEQDETIVDMVANTRLKTPTAVAEFLIQMVNQFENTLDNLIQLMEYSVNQLINSEKQMVKNICRKLPYIVEQKFTFQRNYLHLNWFKSYQNAFHLIQSEQQNMAYELLKLKYAFKNGLKQAQSNLLEKYQNVQRLSTGIVETQKNQLNQYLKFVQLSDPIHILKKGFSITLHNNKLITDLSQVKENDEIITKLYQGTIVSSVIKKNV